ncbi:MAG: MFS family permease, partial [Candidatus Promineifilaceae bacterium]
MRLVTGAKNYIVGEWQILQRLNRNIQRLLLSQVILGFVVEGGILPVLFNLYLLRLNFGPEAIGSINSVGLIVFTICTIPAGMVGQRIGLRKALTFGMFLMFVGFMLIPMGEFLPYLEASGLGPGFAPSLGNAVLHIGLALFFVNNPPFIMKNTTGNLHNSVFGLQSGALALFGFLGSIAAGLIPLFFASVFNLAESDSGPIRYTLILGALLLLVATWFISSTDSNISLRTQVDPADAVKEQPKVNEVETEDQSVIPLGRAFWIWLIIISFCRYLITMGVGANSLFYNIYLDDGLGVSTALIGNISAMGHLIAIPGALLIPYILKRFGSKKALMLISATLTLTLVPMLFPIWWLVGAGHIITTAFGPLRFGIFTVYLLDRTPHEQQPFVSGLQELVIGGAFATMAVFGGYLIGWQGYSFLYIAAIGLVGIGAFFLWGYL